MEIHHKPVFSNYILENLLPEPGNIAIDFTLGEGGHTLKFLEHGVSVVAFERDPKILEKAKLRLNQYYSETTSLLFSEFPHPPICYPINDNYSNAKQALAPFENRYKLALFDLGISMFHYKESQRGFSYLIDEPLDMRLDPTLTESAADLLQHSSKEELATIFRTYGEERHSNGIASKIVKNRETEPITSTVAFAKLIKSFYPPGMKTNPATRCFQALRIYVNKELDAIEKGISAAIEMVAPGGYIAVISYHSLEDRIVKNCFSKYLIKRINTNKYRPDEVQVIPYKLSPKDSIVPSEEEINDNRAARSARLRILQKAPFQNDKK